MESSSMVLQSSSSFIGNTQNPSSSSSSSRLCFPKICCRKFSGFHDKGHLEYYSKISKSLVIRCGKKDKVMEKELKKKLKLVRGLRKDLSTFSEMGFGLNSDQTLVDQVKGKMISEATELLMEQLQKLKAEEKEMKRKRKEEKARLKVIKMQNMEDSSSSSSESSDSECGEVVDMSSLKQAQQTKPTDSQQHMVEAVSTIDSNITLLQTLDPKSEPVVATGLALKEDMSSVGREVQVNLSSNLEQECCSTSTSCCGDVVNIVLSHRNTNTVVRGADPAKKIEVCMGGKCKKSGAAALLEEFQRVVGIEGAVSGCKCMGKCRDGPNVRVSNGLEGGVLSDSVRTPSNPLCIGVGLDDVSLIVSNFFDENASEYGLATAT